ncbi:hypothetical protein [Ruegeria marina]|uniref:hypothetical protein n=1 Tax=Ruegeria marina TaxID=639004 RepID=UPI001FDFB1B7|nr:hypothetical protein [Ruegeria marina]
MAQQQALRNRMPLPSFEESVPLMISFAPNWPLRTVIFRVLGTALVIGAAAMWFMPGSNLSAETALMKLGVSLFFFFSGLALLMIHHQDNQPDAYFDPIRRELRVLQKNNRGRPQTVLRRSYDSLGSARFNEHYLEICDVDGTILMRLPIESAEIRHALRMQLSGLVNISV